MEIDGIPIQQGKWLIDALKAKDVNYKDIPSNVILNKLLPGLGATHMEIKSHRHSIIIEPNVPVILGKAEKDKNILAVWEKCTPNKIRKYLSTKNIKYKKLITTPKGYAKIKEIINEGHDYIYNDYFLLYDECEKITQDHDYRQDISIPLNDFFNKFENKAFVSATPLVPSDPRFEEQGFRILKIEPQYNYKKDINLTVTNNFDSELENYFIANENSNCICIFLNKTDDINKVINTFNIAKQSKVFCSDDSAKKLKTVGFKSQSDLELPLAKYNFFTSRFYSAVDIKLTSSQKPDILILTDSHPFTRVDPKTEVIQIYGRFRNGFNSLTHIAYFDKDIEVLDKHDIDKRLDVMKQVYDAVINKKDEFMFDFSVIPDKTIQQQLQRLDYAKYLDENNKLNCFAVDNMFYDNEVNGYYKSPETLRKAYEETDHFNINYNCVIDQDSDIQDILKQKSISKKVLRQNIVKKLVSLEQNFADRKISMGDKHSTLKFLMKIDDFIIEVYYTLGETIIEKCKYSEAKLKKELEKYKKEKYRLSSEVAQEIYDNFQSREGIYIDKDTILKEIDIIYKRLDINYTVKKNTIEEYYDKPKMSNSKNKPSYKLEVRKIITNQI